eukprot:PhM_4_TR3400/c1_g1_i1/m.29715
MSTTLHFGRLRCDSFPLSRQNDRLQQAPLVQRAPSTIGTTSGYKKKNRPATEKGGLKHCGEHFSDDPRSTTTTIEHRLTAARRRQATYSNKNQWNIASILHMIVAVVAACVLVGQADAHAPSDEHARG